MDNMYQTIFDEAKKASNNAYAPYSNFPVGACALYESGKMYTGCNVENASYGLSICAERNAMSKAVSMGEKTKLVAISVYAPKQKKCVLCGACRQWVYEFAQSGETKIVLEGDDEKPMVLTLNDIFPYGFKFDD